MKKKGVILALLISLLVFTTGCGDKTLVCPDIPDAENTLFTNDGTLFVSGGKNIYKINKESDGSYDAEPLLDESAGIAGMAVYNNFMYVVYSKISLNINYCEIIKESLANGDAFPEILNAIKNAVNDKKIIVADLNKDTITFNKLCSLEETFIPNGLAVDSLGRLYVTDETFVPGGKIIRITIDQGDIVKEVWMDKYSGSVSPNGIAIKNDILYFTDLDLSSLISPKALVKRVDIHRYDNNSSGAITELYKRAGGMIAPLSLFDDLTTETIEGISGVIVTDYNRGSLLFIEDKITGGELHYETDRGLFDSPSSVIRGVGPDFSTNQILVTEKGLIMIDPYSDFGNKVVSVDIE